MQKLKYIIIFITALICHATATAQSAADSTVVSDDELEYWLKEFGQEIVDTLSISSPKTEDESLDHLIKGFGNQVLDTLNNIEASSKSDTLKIVDDKLNYLLKEFGHEVLDTLNGAVTGNKIDTLKLVDDKLNYLLKEFGHEVLDTLNGTKAVNRTDSIKLVDDKLSYLLKEFGKSVVDTLSTNNIPDEASAQKGKSGDEQIEHLIKEFGQNVADSLSTGESSGQEREEKNIAGEILKTITNDTINNFVEQLEQKVDVIMKKVEPIPLTDTISTRELLNEVDSLLVKTGLPAVNPLFIDWVIGVPGAVSMSLTDEDSVIVELRTHVKDYIRATSPELYAFHKNQLPDISELKGSKLNNIGKESLLLNLDTLIKNRDNKLDFDLPKMSKWSLGAKFQVHASQNYISPNWYKGGESNIAGNFYVLGYFNYDNRSGLQWDSKVEWKLGLNSSVSDTLRWLRVNEDLFRINSKVGFKAFKSFYYTAELDFQTQFFNTYKSNSNIRTSGPFSPIRTNFSLGMDYKYKEMISLFVSPISYKYVFVADTTYKEGVLPSENIPNQIGIKDGGRKSHQLGALVRFDFNHDFNESIGMEIKFNFFGNYVGKIKGVEIGCEVIGNFKINRYLTAKAVLYPRYDSTVIPANGGKPKIQFWELISLGFTYKI